ncbi:MAG: bifunctional alpha,alpha-trehalose-phosphate synthase (UDP-forming)/trehalose-phosphatase, partial [Saprospiraceae bacterium]
MSKLIIISNRLPVTIDKKEGELFYHPSAGGLATGLGSLDNSKDKLWVGWAGKVIRDKSLKPEITASLREQKLVPVFLTQKEVELFYEGFSNKVIWPHFHYFTQYTTYNDKYWDSYVKVNQKFANVVAEIIEPDDMIWVHDYQLMLLPQMIREKFPDISIGFFLHIPFPSYEVFRILPWRKQILQGVLGADQIGFHTFGYMRHFLSAAYRITGHEHDLGKLTINNRLVNVDVFPMGIDYNKYAYPNIKGGMSDIIPERFKRKGRKLILSIDRLDYTKGIPERLHAFRKLLDKHPKYIGQVTLAMIVVPSRSNVDQYQELKDEVDTLVGRINADFRSFDWSPVFYFYRSFSFRDLTSLYRGADIALITPLRDGMNLVAKEFIASREESKNGVLILSEMAGAADELTEALIVNPHDANDVAEALVRALEMPEEEQRNRLEFMQDKLRKHTVKLWAETFINEQIEIVEYSQTNAKNISKTESTHRKQLIEQFNTAKNPLVILDYDGTLMNFHNDPQAVVPD